MAVFFQLKKKHEMNNSNNFTLLLNLICIAVRFSKYNKISPIFKTEVNTYISPNYIEALCYKGRPSKHQPGKDTEKRTRPKTHINKYQ